MAVAVRQHQMEAHHLSGRHVPPEYFHVTLHWLGDYEEIRRELLHQFQRNLATTMEAVGIGHHIRKQFNPHVSLLYCPQRLAREAIAPIRWQGDELVLIDSLVGHGKHVDLGTWPLQTRQMSFSDW